MKQLRRFTEGIVETKQFQAKTRSAVLEGCTNASDAILTELTKLTYLKSTQNHKHWKDVLAGIITRNAIKVKGGEFDYSWFFEDRDTYDEELIECYYVTLPERYDSIKPSLSAKEIDPIRLLNNIAKLRKQLTYQYVKLGRFLNKSEIISILDTLDFYHE